MSEKRRSLQTLVRKGLGCIHLERYDPSGPVGRYMASIRINGQHEPSYLCCVLCKQLMKRGKTSARNNWRHKTRHLAGGGKYTDKELEEIIRAYNKPSSDSRQHWVSEQLQIPSMSKKEPIQLLNFPNIQPSQDKDIEMPNEPLGPYVSHVIKFSHPTTIMIAGPTFSGKMTFLKRLLHEDMIEPPPERIIWIYKEKGDESEFARLKQEFPHVEFLSEIDIGRINSLDGR